MSNKSKLQINCQEGTVCGLNRKHNKIFQSFIYIEPRKTLKKHGETV